MKKFPKIKSVVPLQHKRLRVTFENGTVRIYDCRPLLKQGPFAKLKDESVFRAVRPDDHGYGVIWSDEIDLAESELWIRGVAEQEAPTRRSLRSRG
jgi:hypothetical protein